VDFAGAVGFAREFEAVRGSDEVPLPFVPGFWKRFAPIAFALTAVTAAAVAVTAAALSAAASAAAR
jgi:hypothetical protein